MDFYFDLILKERYWSWALVAIIYLIATLFLRQLIFRKLVRETKQVDSDLYASVKRFYLNHSLGGWFLYLFSLLAFVCLWATGKDFSSNLHQTLLWIFLAVLLFFLSLVLHLTAFVRALLAYFRQRGSEREF